MKKNVYRVALATLFAVCQIGAARASDADDFFRAIHVDNDRAVSRLLSRGFDPNTLNEKGQVGLYIAMRDQSTKSAATLVAHPSTLLDQANAAGETPVMMAALRGDADWVVKLLNQGARIDRPGWTPLHYAATGPEPTVVALLLDRGARLDAASPNRTTPLMMAARYGDERSVDLLLARGASLEARNDERLNAADFARLGGRDALADRLERTARSR